MITVVIAVYNVRDYLERCINSVLAQTFQDYELIIIDDGSTDGSGEIADTYGRKYSNVRVVHKKNGGLSSVRNESLRQAKGEYILMIDADDYILPSMLEVMEKYAVINNADIAVCDYYINKEKSIIKDNSDCGFDVMEKEEFMPLILRDEIQSMTWNKLIKKSCFANIVFPDRMNAQDLGVMHLVFNNANRIVFVNEKLYVYIEDESLNPNNITNSNAKKIASSYHRAIHFENRMLFADKRYPECSDYLLNKMARFYLASYFKATYYNKTNDEKELIRQKLLFYKSRLWNSKETKFVLKALINLIICNSPLTKVAAFMYMKYRKFI